MRCVYLVLSIHLIYGNYDHQVLGNKYQSRLLEVIDARLVFQCYKKRFYLLKSSSLDVSKGHFIGIIVLISKRSFREFHPPRDWVMWLKYKLNSLFSLYSSIYFFLLVRFLPVNCQSSLVVLVLVLIKEDALNQTKARGRILRLWGCFFYSPFYFFMVSIWQ